MSDFSFEYTPVGLFKRIMCIIYDTLLLVAILFVVGLIVATMATFLINDGNAITAEHPAYLAYQFLMLMALFSSAFIFFGWFWINGRQTLGMKTWRIQLKTIDNQDLNWSLAAVRFITAIFSWLFLGLGFLWCLFDKKKRSWHDIASSTVFIQLS